LPLGYDYDLPDIAVSDYTLPSLEGQQASFNASAAVVVNWNAGIYRGLLEGSIGLKGELGLAVAGGSVQIENAVPIPVVDQFDLNFMLSMVLAAEALYGVDVGEEEIHLKSWPIITLPSTELKLNPVHKQHTCNYPFGGDESESVARFSLYADQSYPEKVLIDNPYIGTGEWNIVNSDGWYVGSTTIGWTEFPGPFGIGDEPTAHFEKIGLTNFSPSPQGTVVFVGQPQIPPFLKTVEVVQLDTFFPGDASVQCYEMDRPPR